jgi:hypothetical protein
MPCKVPAGRSAGGPDVLLHVTEDEDDVSPWSDGPLIDNASGPIIYFAMRYSMAEEVSAAAARMAADRGLVCSDPQWIACVPPSTNVEPVSLLVRPMVSI